MAWSGQKGGGWRHWRWSPVIFCMLSCAACGSDHHAGGQVADDDWSPNVSKPEFPRGKGPVVLVDAAHGNFHTIDGSFGAFAELLDNDGYDVRSGGARVTQELLDEVRVYVISNAVHGGHDAEWTLPTPPAFTSDEVEVLVEWVEHGGSLLLIADHMPFPGATANLASAFGIVFLNGFAMKSVQDGGILSFTRSSGSLSDHAITRGRTDSEKIESIRSFTGQAFRAVSPVQALMAMPDDWVVLLPTEAWEFGDDTPRVSARGLIQGAVMHRGSGRVAVFGEAAMFTAQTQVNNGVVRTMGMNHPSAGENAQFVLNVMHWLTGSLDD